MVTQETVLFDDSIAANIAYGAATPRAKSRPPRAPRTPTSSSSACRSATTPWIGERGQRLSGRAAPAAGDRARAAQELADPDPGRGHLVARRRVGAPGAGGAREPDARPHVVRDRAPALHRPARGQASSCSNAAESPRSGATRSCCRARRRLCEAVRAADLRTAARRATASQP